jgi:poly(A) polymerase
VPQLDPEKQRAFAVEVVRRLRERSFEAYWAGGCVRDQLLGHAPKDYDVATTARPQEIREIFGARRTVPVGEAFGVVRVLGPRAAGEIEVATFRQDAAYSDGRHPDWVRFSTPQADAERRDFTVNGMFYDPLEDRVIDFVGGRDDLARGILRAIGEPRARFEEDKLRLLRAVRFAASFDFTLDAATREAVEEMAPQVTVVSIERIATEMRLMLVHPSRVRAMILMRETGLLDAVVPELTIVDRAGAVTATGRSADEAWVVTLEVLAVLVEPTFPLALAALLHAFVDPSGSDAICRRLKLSNRDSRRAGWLVANHNALLDARHAAWSRLQRLLTAEGIKELLALHEAIAAATGKDTLHVAHCRELLKLPEAQLDPPPLVTGDDLIAHGIPRGKQYQRLLEAARDAQLEKKVRTKREALELVDKLRAQTPKPD